MSKFFTDKSRSEQQSVHWVALQVYSGGHIWRDLRTADIGIDGEIEFLERVPNEAKSRSVHKFVKVQLKATSDAVVNNKLRFKAKRENCKDWAAYGDSTPIIGIVYSTDADKAVWLDLSVFARRFLKLVNDNNSHSVDLDLDTYAFTSACLTADILPLVRQWDRAPSLKSQLQQLFDINEDDVVDVPTEDIHDDDIATPSLNSMEAAIDAWIEEFGTNLDEFDEYEHAFGGDADNSQQQTALKDAMTRQFVVLPRALFNHRDLFSAAQTLALVECITNLESDWLEALVYAFRQAKYRTIFMPYLLGLSPSTSKSVAEQIRNGMFGDPDWYSSPLLSRYLSWRDKEAISDEWRHRGQHLEWRWRGSMNEHLSYFFLGLS